MCVRTWCASFAEGGSSESKGGARGAEETRYQQHTRGPGFRGSRQLGKVRERRPQSSKQNTRCLRSSLTLSLALFSSFLYSYFRTSFLFVRCSQNTERRPRVTPKCTVSYVSFFFFHFFFFGSSLSGRNKKRGSEEQQQRLSVSVCIASSHT